MSSGRRDFLFVRELIAAQQDTLVRSAGKKRRVEIVASWGAASSAPTVADRFVGRLLDLP
jgi:hypothetical protein